MILGFELIFAKQNMYYTHDLLLIHKDSLEKEKAKSRLIHQTPKDRPLAIFHPDKKPCAIGRTPE